MNIEILITIIAIFALFVSAVTLSVISVLEIRRYQPDYKIVTVNIVQVIVIIFLASGFTARLMGWPVNAAVFFRPLVSIFVALSTGINVVYFAQSERRFTKESVNRKIKELEGVRDSIVNGG